ncbi:MAG: hypothetical protein IJM08_07070, partial [Firmicutes bacterium]|nr:hypothetical protein [Bacillota bacterium]
LADAAKELENKGEKDLALKAQQYSEAFNKLYAVDVINPDEKALQEAHGKLSGFSEFISGGKPGEVSNYEKITSCLPDYMMDLCNDGLPKLNQSLELGLDTEALVPKKEAEDAVQQEAEPEIDEIDEPDQENLDGMKADELADNGGRRSAAAYIETIRDNGFPEKDPAKLNAAQKELALDRMLKIMAARELVDSERGSKKKLQSNEVDPADVKRRAEMMKKDPTFQKFLQALSDDPKKFKAAMSAATKRPGHGGGLDDMFKSYVKNQPPCEFRNDTILMRYMPTVKERLEVLQDQFRKCLAADKEMQSVDAKLDKFQKKGTGKDKAIENLTSKRAKLDERLSEYAPHRVAGEMIALRNLIKADKGDKLSLEKPIPVSDAGDELWDEANTIYNESGELFYDNKTCNLILDGHGGKMMERVRKQAHEDLDPRESAALINILDKNSIKVRMEQIEKEAEDLKTDLANCNEAGEKNEELMKRSKNLLGEYLLLDGKTRNKQTGEIDEELLLNEVPYGEIENMKLKGPESNKAFEELVGGVDQEQMQTIMDNLSDGDQKEFITSLANQKLENEKLRTGDDFSETQDLQSEMDENVSELNENEAIEDLKPIVL